jgi:hypothetical protein
MTVTAAPLRASSVASRTAEVDFPAPPLGLAKTMVGILKLSLGFVAEKTLGK